DLYEFEHLPGFSMVAFERQIDYFNEGFQFDIIHSPREKYPAQEAPCCQVPENIKQHNLQTICHKLPKKMQDNFRRKFAKSEIFSMDNYPVLLPFLLHMDRGHVLALDGDDDFYLTGTYASFPSDLDTELKRFGVRIKKFVPDNNYYYELNRNFVYQYLMELYGFPIVSERRTSAALFSRRLFKLGETFMIRVLGQSDRCITTLYTHPDQKFYPRVEKLALFRLDAFDPKTEDYLHRHNFFVDPEKKVVLLRVVYKQHKYDPNNVQEDRALSVLRQELVNPVTGESCTRVNLIKDTSYLTLKLNDIVKGEYTGRVKYKREIVENTDTHEKRLKFLYAWLSKHQRRIVGYSEEFYSNVIKVLDNYLLNPDNSAEFSRLSQLYQEVWEKYSFIRQTRKIRLLEDLKHRKLHGKKLNYLEMLQEMYNILNELKFELVDYYEQVVAKAMAISSSILDDRYLHKKYLEPHEDTLTDYGRGIRKLYGHTVNLLDDLQAIRRAKSS
ncbi:MAG: hypothetical protein ACLFMP_06135, partial [Desulfonatronovibrionaceae bacterium]